MITQVQKTKVVVVSFVVALDRVKSDRFLLFLIKKFKNPVENIK